MLRSRSFLIILLFSFAVLTTGCDSSQSQAPEIFIQNHTDDEQLGNTTVTTLTTTLNAWERNENLGYFADVEMPPLMKEGEITERLVEAYYTNNGHLYMRMILSNGDQRDVQLKTVEVRLHNGEDQFIGGGKFNVENKIIPAEGTLEYTCYLKPEHLEIKDDSLMVLTYMIDANGYYN